MLTDGKSRFKYAVCKDCGIAYHQPSMTAAEYEAYNEWGWQHLQECPYGNQQNSMNRAKENWAILKQIVQKGDRIFDIGCGDGSLVNLARDAGYGAEGFETSGGAITAGKQWHEIELMGELPDEEFDVVSLHSVLEHVYDGEWLIAQALKVLTDDGKLVIKMPDFNFQKRGWWAYSPEHPCLYTRAAIVNMMQEFGFELTRHWPQGDRATYVFESNPI